MEKWQLNHRLSRLIPGLIKRALGYQVNVGRDPIAVFSQKALVISLTWNLKVFKARDVMEQSIALVNTFNFKSLLPRIPIR